MSGDIAVLGFQIESKGLVEGTNSLDKLTASAQKAETAASKMGKTVSQAGQGIATGSKASERLIAHLQRMEASLQKIERGMSPVAAGIGRAASAMEAMGTASTRSSAGLDRVGMSATKANDNLDRMVKKATDAAAVMDRINRSTGVTTMGVSVGRGDDLKAYGAELDNLRAKFNPLFSIGKQYRETVSQIEDAHRKGAISAHEMTAAIEEAASVASAQQTVYTRLREGIDAVGGTSKLTKDQLQNLSFQINDVTTMALSGASAFQIAATQGGQFFQVLQGGNGVKASLGAIGSSIASFAKAIPVAGYAVAGLTAGVAALWYMTKGPEARSAEESLKSFEQAIKRLEDGWKGAGAAAKQHYEAAKGSAADNQSAALLDTAARLRELRKDYQNAVRDLNSAPGLPEDILRARAGGMSDAHREIRDLYTDLRKGEITAADFAKQMRRIRLDPKSAPFAAQFADMIRIASENAQDLERRINAIADGVDRLGGKGGRVTTNPNEANPFDLRDRFGGVTGPAGRLDPSSMDGMRDQLRGQRQEFESYTNAAKAAQDALANFDLSPVKRQLAETAQSYDVRIEALKRSTNDTISLTALQAEKEAALALITKEATRAEETRRAGYALDLKAVGDITAAQKAATDGQRAYNEAIAAGYDKSYANARSAEASALSMAQARQQLAEAGRQNAQATERQIEQAQLEYDLIGKSAGEAARLRMEFELLAQAKDAARAAGFDEATVSLTQSMKDQAAEVARLTEATQRLNFERDLLFDRQQAGRSPEDQRIAEQLKGYGIEFESAQGRVAAAQLRVNERLHEANDRLYEMRDAGKEAFGDLVDAIGNGEDALGAFVKAFAGVGKALASAGLDRLFNGLFGTGTGSGGKGASGIQGMIQAITGVSSVVTAANQNTRAPSAGASYAAPAYSVPTPTSRPEFVGQAAAAVSGQLMTYAARFNKGVDSRLMTILETAAQRFPGYRVEAVSGVRPGDPRFHGKGLAADVQIYGANGKAFNNYQHAGDFRVYEMFAQEAKRAQEKLFPALGELFRWGGYFSGGKGKYGALDSMHFDLGGAGMGGGSWEKGLTASQRRLWSGVQSVGMGQAANSNSILGASARDFEKATARGVQSGIVESYDKGRFDAGSPGNPSGMTGGLTRGQAVLGGLAGLAGIAANGYQSGNPLMGGLSGAMGGLELGGTIASAFPAMAGIAGPAGMAIGAAVGLVSSPIGKRKPATGKDMQRRYAEYLAKKGNDDDSDQRLLAA